MQPDLFDDLTDTVKRILPLSNADVCYFPAFLSALEADRYLSELVSSLAWRQELITVYGREVKTPRLQAWYGSEDAVYAYSGLVMTPLALTPALSDLKAKCERACGTQFNSVLANLYRNEQDSMGWHADDEPELGPRPVITSLTLGAIRDFDFRHKISKEKYRLPLEHGSLLIMSGDTQKYWQHGISKRRTELGLRVNLTFRKIVQVENQVIRSHL